MSTKTPVRTKHKEPSIGSIIDTMADIRELRRELAAKDASLKADYDAAEIDLIAALKNQGLDKSSSPSFTASISSTIQYDVADWDAFMMYVAKNKAWHLVQRRASVAAVREVVELDKKHVVPPGLEQFEKETINLRTLR